MKPAGFIIRHLLSLSLLLSVIVHFGTGVLFVFTLNPLSESHKPNFVFLGSFLTQRDFAGRPQGQKITQGNLAGREINAILRSQESTPYVDQSINKSHPTRPLDELPKKTLKSTFYTEGETADKTQTDTQPTSYKPLKFQLR